MNNFSNKLSEFFDEFGEGKKLVLSTADNNKVTSRMMSIVQINGSFYFQTDMTFRKYQQINHNPFVALCIDNIQIEGVCTEIGHPSINEAFCRIYKKYFSGSFNMYSSLDHERLFIVTPTYIERWIYKEGMPFLEIFDVERGNYKLKQYKI